MSVIIRHTGIVTRDLNRALPFYRDLLGFEVVRTMEESGPFIDALLGEPGVCVTTVKMKAAAGQTLLELLAFQNPVRGQQEGTAPDFFDRGPTHVALTVDDLAALRKRLEDAGTVFVSDTLKSPDGRAIVCFCRDPDGSLLELVQETGEPP